MAASNSTVKSAQTLTQTAAPSRSNVAVYADLFKARLTLLVLLTTLTGFYVGTVGKTDFALLFHTIFGTAMVASGAAALNQLLERLYDARMARTRNRPLPSGELTPRKVMYVGGCLSIAGIAYLATLANPITGALAFASWFLYVLVYTPLKRVTWLNTAVGAIPGGLPPLIGWAAARGELSFEGLSLFGILALWQVPHFLAIAWMYKEEYARAGFMMLPAVDPSGTRTTMQTLVTSAGLLLLSLVPFVLGMTGKLYLAAAIFLGAAFVWCALGFYRTLSIRDARVLFFASIMYLPLLLGVMVWDKA